MAPFNGLHSVLEISPPLISRPAAASFPPGEAGGWLRRVSPFNVPGLLSNLGRASVASPTVVGNFGWHHSTGRVKMLLFLPRERTGRVRAVAGLVKIQRASLKTFRFPPRKRHRAGQGRGWIRKSPKGVSKKALLKIQPAVGFRPNHERLAFCRVFHYAVGERSRKKNKGGMNIWNRFISVSGLQPSGGSGG